MTKPILMILSLSISVSALAAPKAKDAAFANSVTFSVGNPDSDTLEKISPKKVPMQNLLGDEARSILADPKLKAQVKDAVARARKAWDQSAEKLNLPARGHSFESLMDWSRVSVEQGNTGVAVTITVPAEFNSGAQPTLETVISGYTDDQFVNISEPETRKTSYSL